METVKVEGKKSQVSLPFIIIRSSWKKKKRLVTVSDLEKSSVDLCSAVRTSQTEIKVDKMNANYSSVSIQY